MKRLVRWIIQKVRSIKNTKAQLERAEEICEEIQVELWAAKTELEFERSKNAELEAYLQSVWMERLDEEDAKESLRIQQETDDYLEDLRDKRREEDEFNNSCEETVENFSEHPSLSAEDDAEPLSPEMEFWNTRCSKCDEYPEFCQCDEELED